MYKSYIVNYKDKNGLLTLAFSGSSKPVALQVYLNKLLSREDISELKIYRQDFIVKNNYYTLKEITGKVNKMIEKM